VMIVDDTLLRVGSANLNNRSMGTDSECDLALEAKSEAHRAIIRDIRARLIGDHCGVTVQAVNAELIAHGSLIRAAENLSGHGHRLRPIEDGEPDHGDFAEYIEGLADPERPIQSKELVSQFFAERVPRKMPPLLKAGLIVAAFVALTIAWQFPPLSDIASPAHVGPMLRALAQEEWAPVLVIGLYIAGGLIGFPVLLLIAATAATFGPTTGLLYATAGSLASAIVTYAVGAAVGRESLRQLLGPRLKRVQRRIVSGGVLAISTIRLIPIAPFTVVNLVAGASEIKLSAYIAGTVIGMAPGLLLMSALGHQFVRILSEPKPADFAMLFGVIVAWLALVGGVQLLFVKFGRNA
jgi:phospholipase D1/2